MRSILAAAVVALIAALAPQATRAADGCYICTSGSSCGQYCRYGSSDTQDKRKACRKAGCKIGGTASCPSAANIRVCAGVTYLPERDRSYAELDRLLDDWRAPDSAR
jgi:hypothetical protein